MKEETIYLVENYDPEFLNVQAAASPEEAAQNYIWEYGPEAGSTVIVYESERLFPEIDVTEALQDYGEYNPEDSPLGECWTTFIGLDKVKELQAIVDEWIKNNTRPYYMARKEVYVVTVPEEVE